MKCNRALRAALSIQTIITVPSAIPTQGRTPLQSSALMQSRHPLPPLNDTQADALTAEDPRAHLILQILLATVELPPPNMAQLLLGFPLDSDSHVLPPDPHRFYSCLSVVLQVHPAPPPTHRAMHLVSEQRQPSTPVAPLLAAGCPFTNPYERATPVQCAVQALSSTNDHMHTRSSADFPAAFD